MKTYLNIFALVILIITSNNLAAQSYLKGGIYNITKDMTINGSEFPDQCDACTINISRGVTLTISKEVSVPGTAFNGGNIVLNNKMSMWSASQFTDTKVTVNNNGSIVSSASMTITNTEFVFNGKSTGIFYAKVDMIASKMTFLENSSMEVTGTVNLTKNSALIAGDITKPGAAFIKFNGGTLNVYDNSYVSLQGSNNYYYSWSKYNGSGKSYTTTNNNINCGTAGKNECSAPVVYGPSNLSVSGIASSAVLPVTLSAFTVKLTGTRADINWATDMELNASRYEIERSIDGMNWSTVGSVKAYGTASVVSRYAFTDVLKINGTVSYRLKMIDTDESFAYSPIKTLRADAGFDMNIYPNPATNYVVISSKSHPEKMNVQLISQSGQVLKQNSGTGNINFTVSEFGQGNYFVRVTDSAGAARTFKLMIVK